MSGAIELVGLALASFPLIISALEHYQTGYDGLQDWVSFRREFANLVNELNREQFIFIHHVEAMLRTIVNSEFQIKEMMNDITIELWKDPSMVLNLKEKFRDEGQYETYRLSLCTIRDSLDRMHTKLKACRPPDKFDRGAGQNLLQTKFRKLQFVLRKPRWQAQVKDLGRQIERLDKFFGAATSVVSVRRSLPSAAHQAFSQIKRQASSLHEAITKALTIKCTRSHTVNLSMWKPSEQSGSKDSVNPVLKVVLFPHQQEQDSSKSQDSFASQKDHAYALHAFDTTHVTQCADGNPLSVNRSRDDSHNSDDQSIGSTLIPTISSNTTTSSASNRYSHYSAGSLSRQKSPESLTTSSDTPTTIYDLCEAIHSRNSKAVVAGYIDDHQGRYHILRPNISPCFNSTKTARPIHLDDLLNHHSTGGKSEDSDILNTACLSRRTRMSIASKLANAILRLYPSPWLPSSFRKMDIYFLQDSSGDIIIEHPFLICKAHSAVDMVKTKSLTVGDDNDHSHVLLALGIMIMELWFGQTLESLPLWKNHCDENGKERELSRFTAAVEWQQKAKDEAGVVFHDITLRCIRGNFGVPSMDLNSIECVKAVHELAVKPLEGLLGHTWPKRDVS